jgi:hypothetical protein
MKWPTDSEAMKRKRQTAADFAWGFASGLLVCVVLSLIVRNC